MAKVMISVPDELLRRIDAAARERRSSRSGFLQLAAERELDLPTPEAVQRALSEGQALFADIGAFDSAVLVREDRDRRKR
jgi:predicted transcriptional regulator